MNTFQIKGALHEYKALNLSGLDVANSLGRMDKLKELCNFPARNMSIKDMWKKISTSFYAESPTASKIPDIIVWSGAALVMSEACFNSLSPYLENEGEFLSVDVEGSTYHIFNCLQYAKENEDQTLTQYVDGEAIGLEALEFDDQDISTRLLFKSKRQGGSILYCTTNFKALCDELKVKGLIFDKDLLSPFI